MSKDKEPLIGLDELARMLEAHEGPDEARRKPAGGRSSGARWTWSVAAGALVVGSGLGFGLGSSLTPSGNAAGPAGIGFVPDSGWRVFQSGDDATRQQPVVAIASNVRLDPADEARGLWKSSGLPYQTLLGLPADGVVLVVTFTLPPEESWIERFPERSLPLRLRDATPFVRDAAQIRPERPLGAYELRANVGDRDVLLHVYFGSLTPSEAMITAAQRQLDRLVVQPARRPSAVERRALPLQSPQSTAATASTKLIDRTFVCLAGFGHGARLIVVRGRTGFRKGERFEWISTVSISTPGNPLPRSKNYEPGLAGVGAGWPTTPPLTAGGLGFNTELCKPSRARVAFTRRGLIGGAPSFFGEEVSCQVPKTVLVRVRASFVEPVTLEVVGKEKDGLTAVGRMEKGQVAVRTPSGRRLAYGEVYDSGKARLFVDRSCA